MIQEQYLIQVEKELRLRNYDPKMIKSYLGRLRDFFSQKINNSGNANIDIEFIQNFLLNKKKSRIRSADYQSFFA